MSEQNGTSNNGMEDMYSKMANKLDDGRRDRFETATKIVSENMERLNLSEENEKINKAREESEIAAAKENGYEPPALRNPKSKGFTFLICVGIMLIVLAIQLVIGLPVGSIISRNAQIEISQAGYTSSETMLEEYTKLFTTRYSEATGWITLLVTVVSMIIGIIWYLKRFIGRDYGKSLRNSLEKLKSRRMIGIIILLGIGCQYAMAVVSGLETLLMPSSFIDSYTETFGMNGLTSFWGILAIVIAAPINEEVFFRGIILNKMRSTGATVGAVLTAALLFSIMHMIPFQVIYTIPAGLVLAYVGYRYKSIWPTMIIHAIANASTFPISAISDKISEKISPALDFGLCLLLAVVCLLGAYLLMKGEKSEVVVENAEAVVNAGTVEAVKVEENIEE